MHLSIEFRTGNSYLNCLRDRPLLNCHSIDSSYFSGLFFMPTIIRLHFLGAYLCALPLFLDQVKNLYYLSILPFLDPEEAMGKGNKKDELPEPS